MSHRHVLSERRAETDNLLRTVVSDYMRYLKNNRNINLSDCKQQ